MRCDTCGNEYERAFRISGSFGEYVFDSFECAIEKLAPSCAHCGCRVIGHGVDHQGTIYCCEHCARHGSTAAAATSG